MKTSETKPAKESTKQQKLERVSVKHLQAKKKNVTRFSILLTRDFSIIKFDIFFYGRSKLT